jgi:hypothetical protein
LTLKKVIQGDLENCVDILTSGRTPQYVTIEPIMPYTNADIFREKRDKSFSKKVWESLNFMKKWVKKIIDFFVVIYSELSHFNRNLNINLNLNHKWLSPT